MGSHIKINLKKSESLNYSHSLWFLLENKLRPDELIDRLICTNILSFIITTIFLLLFIFMANQPIVNSLIKELFPVYFFSN